MRLLELFCGTKSIGKAFEALGWDVTSVDIDPSFSPTIVSDILQLEISELGTFDHVHASPPCTQYSCARTTALVPRDLEGADLIVEKALDIIDFCISKNGNLTWTMENPQTGLLKTRAVVQGLPFKDVTYCRYACDEWNPGYKKATRIWTNLEWTPRALCCKANPCPAMQNGRHPTSAQRLKSQSLTEDSFFTRSMLYSMPPELCRELAQAATC